MQTLHDTRLPNALNINCLKDIAVIRATLDALSTHLGDDFAVNIERVSHLPTCLEAARHLCSNPSRFPIQLFLLKQLVRNDPNGIDAVNERCKRKELKWVMPPLAEVNELFFLTLNFLFYSLFDLRCLHSNIMRLCIDCFSNSLFGIH